MCLVTTLTPPSTTTRTTTGGDDRNTNMPISKSKSSATSARLGRHGSRRNRKSKIPRGDDVEEGHENNPTRTSARARIWLLLVAGTCWSIFTLHRSFGREEFSSIVHQEMEQESKYLASLFEKVSHDAQVVLSGQAEVVFNGGQQQQQQQQQTANIAPPAPAPAGIDLRQLTTTSREQPPAPPPAATPHDHHHRIDFSKLHGNQHHAILIPYRDRKFHLEQFIEHMGPYLQRNFPDDTFELWLIEQDDTFLFNRAWLANVGIANIKLQNRNYKHQLAKQQQQYFDDPNGHSRPITVPPPPRCIILHDVDLIPTVDGVPYTNCSRPMQLGSELAHFNNSIPYPIYTGGVGPTMLLEHWTKINGMSNDFYGWGGEDDDLWHRLRLTGLLKKPVPRPTPPQDPSGAEYKGPKFWPPEIERPAKGFGKFRPISEAQTVHHNQKNHNQWNRIGYMLELMQNNSARWKKDGLSDLKMTVTGDAMTVTHWESIETDNKTLTTDPTVLSTSRATTTTLTKKHYVTAKQPGSIISSLSVEPNALASFAAIHHIKAIPKLTALEFIHVTQTDGSRIERAGAAAGIAWGACHFKHALEKEMKCPDIAYPEWEGRLRMRAGVSGTHDPWHSPLQDFEENPYSGRPTFAVVRNPYQRLIEFFHCPWNGYKGNIISPATLNHFIQNALYPDQPPPKEGESPPPSPAYLHLRPQFHYIFANNKISAHSKPFVTHVLRYENMDEEFNNLMHMYNLNNVKLPTSPLVDAPPRPVVLTPKDFSIKTLKQIHKFYAGDFGRFRYRQIRTTPLDVENKVNPLLPGEPV